MSRNLDDIFNECYERIRFGESLESVLRSYPQYRSQLEPLLRTTFDIGRRASFIQPRPEFRHWARVRFESAMQYPQRQQEPVRRETQAASMWLRHGWAVIVSAGIVLMLGVGSTMAASSQAMPTDPLYALKPLTEDVQRAFAVSPDRKAQFETDIANIRAAELQAMADAGNAQEAAKAAQRYDDQFEKAVQAILATEGTEPIVTRPPVATPVTTPTPVTPTPVVTPPVEVPTPVVTSTDNGTAGENAATENTTQSGTATPPAVPVTSENTTPPDTPAVTTGTGEQPTAVTEEQPAVTEEQPATTTSGSTQSSKAQELRDRLNRQKSTVEQSLKDAREKASHQDKSNWQDTIDKVSKKTATRTTSEQSDSSNQTTIQTDNKTVPNTGSDKNRPSSSNRHR